jgi:3D (Asp-Asp-Asp) domain-containing protein
MRSSLYYVAVERDYPSGGDGLFRDAEGRVLYRASRAYLAAASIEGSAKTAAGATLVFDPANPRDGWRWSRTPYGLDALGCPLVPYRTVAVPPRIPLGTTLYIPETVGLRLPDGTRHDGVWYATDRGVGIDGDRIDLFMHQGRASMATGEAFGLEYLRPLHVRILARIAGCPPIHGSAASPTASGPA